MDTKKRQRLREFPLLILCFMTIGVCGGRWPELLFYSFFEGKSEAVWERFEISARALGLAPPIWLMKTTWGLSWTYGAAIYLVILFAHLFWRMKQKKAGASGSIGERFMMLHLFLLLGAFYGELRHNVRF